MKSTPADSALDGLLAGRGWALVERTPAGDVYDWIEPAMDADDEPRYVIVASDHDSDPGARYRVWLGDGQRLAYDCADCLAADLDRIETHRRGPLGFEAPATGHDVVPTPCASSAKSTRSTAPSADEKL